MIFFSQRKKLEELFLKWAKENGAATSPMNVVAFLQINNLLNEEKIREFLAEHETVVKSVTPSGIDWKEWEEFWA